MKDQLFSVILLSYFSEARMREICKYYSKRLDAEKIPFELIIVDDGSTDDSYKIALQLEKEDSRIRAYQLSKNYTSPYSQFAGLHLAKGACATFVSDDYQRPLDNLILSYRKWQEGHKIVISFRESREDGFFNNLFSNGFYFLMNKFSDVKFPKGGTDGFLADREVIDILTQRINPVNTTAVIEALRLGFDPCFIPLERPSTKSKSRWTFKKKIRLAKDSFFSVSSFPIRLITWLGFWMFLFSMILIVMVVFAKFYADNKLFGFSIPGWTTIVVLTAFFHGITLFSLGIVSEYMWRIYQEVKGRPGFIIKKKDTD